MGITAKITGVGHYVPPDILTNQELEKMVETSDEWITSRTGIKERRILSVGKGSSYMGAFAAKRALEEARVMPEELELIIVATVTPDMMFPNTGCLIQDQINAKKAWAVDVNGACTGFIYATAMGCQFIESGRYKKVLVVGSDKMSSITDYTDRNTCILFGDAAAAIVLEPSVDSDYGILDFILKSDGSGQNFLYLKGGAGMADITYEILKKNQVSPEEIKLFIPHQANKRIIDATARRLNLPPEKVLLNIEKYGNTTAATIPLGLSEAYLEGNLNKGDIVLFAAFGAGFTWGSMLLRWAI
jgi:3-oxoacyl-[acyl-carrier-protein] synthase-3